MSMSAKEWQESSGLNNERQDVRMVFVETRETRIKTSGHSLQQSGGSIDWYSSCKLVSKLFSFLVRCFLLAEGSSRDIKFNFTFFMSQKNRKWLFDKTVTIPLSLGKSSDAKLKLLQLSLTYLSTTTTCKLCWTGNNHFNHQRVCFIWFKSVYRLTAHSRTGRRTTTKQPTKDS